MEIGHILMDVTGDFMTEELGRLLASLCGDHVVPES
ncbi:MAG: DUF1186 domain-containing protein [Leptolyngbyaceae cyanobacterium]